MFLPDQLIDEGGTSGEMDEIETFRMIGAPHSAHKSTSSQMGCNHIPQARL